MSQGFNLCLLFLITTTTAACQINKHTTHHDTHAAASTTSSPTQSAQPGDVTSAATTTDVASENTTADAPQAAEYLTRPLRLTPTTDLTQNPTQLGKFKGNATRHLARFYDLDYRQCHGYIDPAPALILNTSNASDPYRITAHGDIDVLFIEFQDREVLCQRRSADGKDPVIELPNPHGRTYRVYAGRFKKLAPVDYSLTFENLAKPVNVDWIDASITPLQIDNDLTAPQLITTHLPASSEFTETDRSPVHGDTSCLANPGNLHYALKPDIRLDVQQSTNVTLGIRTPERAHMTLIGPVPADRRNIPTHCLPTHTETRTLEAGTYFIRIGHIPDAAPTAVHFFAHGANAGLDPLTHFTRSATNTPSLSTHARTLSMHYPFLSADLLLTNDAIRQQLFASVAPSLYVVATQDITPDLPVAIFHGPRQDDDTLLEDGRSPEFPRKDELLLLLNEHNIVLAADGSLFTIPAEYLKPAEQADVITLPATVRNTRTFFRHALKLADDSDQGRLEQHTQRQQRYQQCVDKNASDKNPPESPHIARICGLDRLTTENQRFWRQLEDSRTSRRNQALQNIRTHLADLVLVK